jgi:hypothetical protein
MKIVPVAEVDAVADAFVDFASFHGFSLQKAVALYTFCAAMDKSQPPGMLDTGAAGN